MSGSTTTEQGQHPFGENWYPTNPDEKWKFTSYERDVESGNDYAMFRSYVNRYGRFLTPDPAGVATADTTNPQTWNRYAYVGNDSVNFVDPLGLCPAPGVWLDPSVRRGCVFVTRVTGGSYLCSVDGARTDCGLAIALIHAGSAYPSSTGAGDCSAGVDGMVFCGPNEIPFNAADYIRSLPPGLTLQLTNYLRNTEAAAANNALFSDKQLSCAGKALKKNAFSLALDVAGFLPGGSLAGGFFQMGVDVASTIDSARKGDAVGAMVYGIGGFHTDAIQTAYRAGGFGAARGLLKSVGRSGAKAVPIFGTFLNLASTLKDVWDTYGDYTQCMSNSVR
jgi:RHS repeat-associated protein